MAGLFSQRRRMRQKRFIQDVGFVLLILSASLWLVRLPVAMLGVFVLGWGVSGAWMGAATEINVRGLLYTARFRSGRWQRLRV